MKVWLCPHINTNDFVEGEIDPMKVSLIAGPLSANHSEGRYAVIVDGHQYYILAKLIGLSDVAAIKACIDKRNT